MGLFRVISQQVKRVSMRIGKKHKLRVIFRSIYIVALIWGFWMCDRTIQTVCLSVDVGIGNYRGARRALDSGANPNARWRDYPSLFGDPIRFIADLSDDEPILYRAVVYADDTKDLRILQMLLKYGADPNARVRVSPRNGDPDIICHPATYWEGPSFDWPADWSIVRELISAGADPRVEDDELLYQAQLEKNSKMVAFLIDKGLDPNFIIRSDLGSLSKLMPDLTP